MRLRAAVPTAYSKEMPVSPNKYRKGVSSPKGVGHNASGESKGGNGAKKNGNGSKRDEKKERKKEDKTDKPVPSSSFEQGTGQSQSEFSLESMEPPEQSADMDTTEVSLSSSFAASALLTSSTSDIHMATSISSLMTMAEFSEETTPACDLGMRRQLEEPINAGLEITSEMLDLTSEIPTESIPESERSAEEACLADIRTQHQNQTMESDLFTAVPETSTEDMETEESLAAKSIAEFQELLQASQNIEGDIEILESISDKNMEDELIGKEIDEMLDSAEPDLGEEVSKVSESDSQTSQDDQMGSRRERECCTLPSMNTVSDRSQTPAPSVIVDEKAR